jgi:hypothetical protein
LDALLKANEALLSTLELDPLLHNVLAAAIAAIPAAEMGTIVLYDSASQQFRVQASYGYRDPRIQGIDFAEDPRRLRPDRDLGPAGRQPDHPRPGRLRNLPRLARRLAGRPPLV